MKDQLSLALLEELTYLSEIEQETIKRKKAAEDLLLKIKKHG